MDDWKNFNRTSLPEKEEFYSILNVKNITDAGYMHVKRVCKDFEIKNVGDCHDALYLKSDTLLLADVFKNVRKMGFKMHHLYSINIISTTTLTCQAIFKKTEVKLELLTDIDMLLKAEKGIRGGIYHAIYRYATANNRLIKDYNKDKKPSYITYCDVKKLYGCAMQQKLPVNNFELIKDTSQFNQYFIKVLMKKVMKDIFSKLMFNVLKNYMNFIMIWCSYQKK